MAIVVALLKDIDTRRRVGHTSAGVFAHNQLTVRQNLELHARLFHLGSGKFPREWSLTSQRFNSTTLRYSAGVIAARHSPVAFAVVAVIHRPEMLILDETDFCVNCGQGYVLAVDGRFAPGESQLSSSTHFMNEAERCDRISLMHAGSVRQRYTAGTGS